MCGKELRMARPWGTLLTSDELAECLKRSKSTLYHLARRGVVPGQKIGRHRRFHRDAIDKWLGRHATSARKGKAK